jgi:ribonucleoside-diphosphate reductase alpha chain
VFAFKDGTLDIKDKHGYISKGSRGVYSLLNESDEILIKNVAGGMEYDEEVFTRLLSTSLRHGTPHEFLLHQLDKIEGPLNHFSKAVARCLKKYVKDGTKVHGETCPKCGSDKMIRISGCNLCSDCGDSKCL